MSVVSLPGGWSIARLGDILPLSYGKALVEDKRDSNGNIPVYGSSGVVGVHNQVLVDRPAIIVGRKGNVGAVYFSAESSWVIDTAYYSDGFGLLNLSFFHHLLTFIRLAQLDRSTAVPGLSRDDYNVVEIGVPPQAEQARIVAEIEKQFTRLDAAVAALKRVQANLKRYRAAVLKAACEGRLVPTEAELARKEGRTYGTGEQLLARILKERRARWEADQFAKLSASGKSPQNDDWKKRYKEPEPPDTSNLPSLPDGWVWASMGQVFGVFVGATPSRAKIEYWNGSIPWVSSGEVAFCRIRQTREQITESGLANASTVLHAPGTILLGMIGEGKTRGQAAILEISACNNQNSAAIRVSEAGLPPEYVYRYLEGQYERTRTLGSGNNQPALNRTRVERMTFPLPPISEQHRIVSVLESKLSLVDALEHEIANMLPRADSLRRSVLKRAFEGKLVPQDANDEPASVLLDRLRSERAGAVGLRKVSKKSSQKKLKAYPTIS